MPCSRIGHTTLSVRLPAPDAGRVSNVDCRHHRFPLTPLPYAEEKLPRLCSPDDGGERENSLRLAGLDLRNRLDGYRAITVFDSAGQPHL